MPHYAEPVSPERTPDVAFRSVTRADFALLRRWLSAPHVARWWHHDVSPEGLEESFGPGTRGEEPGEDLVVEVDGRPVALVQRCLWTRYPEELEELAPYVDLPEDAATIDYLIGDPADTGRGLGPVIIRALTADTWRVHPTCPAIVVPVPLGNRRSWRALERAGFRQVGTADLLPDNPLDPLDHVVLRLDRP